MIKKKIQSYIKIQIPAGMANPSPPVGPALGQKGINIMEFCKMFNSKTIDIEKGTLIPVVISVYIDRTFSFILKSPPVSILLKKAANITSGSSKPRKEIVGKVKYEQLLEIAKIKSIDMTGKNIDKIISSIIGTALSMGLEMENTNV